MLISISYDYCSFLTANKWFNETELMSNVYQNPDAVTEIAASDIYPLTFTNLEMCTLAGCDVSDVNLCSHDTASRNHAFPSEIFSHAYNGFENTS